MVKHTHTEKRTVRQMDTGAWLQGLLSLAWLTGQLSGSLTGLVGGISIGVEESKKSKKHFQSRLADYVYFATHCGPQLLCS